MTPPAIRNRRLDAISHWLILTIAFLGAALLPVGYLIVAYPGLSERVEIEAEVRAHTITQLISTQPDLWSYQLQRLEEIVTRGALSDLPGQVTIRDASNNDVITLGAPPLAPVLRRRHALFDAGTRVGEVEVAHSGRTVLVYAIGVTIAGVLTGGILYALLRRLTRQVQDEQARRDYALSTSMDGYAALRSDGRLIESNAALSRMLGLPKERLRERRLSDLEASTAGEHESGITDARLSEVIATGHQRFQTQWQTAQGSVIDVELTSSYHAEHREIYVFVRDVTERNRMEHEIRSLNAELERRVADRTQDLEATNRELNSFSHSVAHDLRAPIRAIAGFAEILRSDLGATLDAHSADYLERIDAAALRMGRLVDDLLRLARITRTEKAMESVDLSQIARSICDAQSQGKPGRKVEFLVEPTPMVVGDPGLLRILLENLIGNAWKFTGQQATALIEFGHTAREDGIVFHVRDNGVGFDMQYAAMLFKAFQRLHHPKDFEGTGIGLSIAQRVIQRHGGKIWAKSTPGKGATFFFTIG